MVLIMLRGSIDRQLNQLEILCSKIIITFINYKHSDGKHFRLEIHVVKHKNSIICAVSACKKYLALRYQKRGPFFIQSNGQAVSRQFFKNALNDALNFCGLNTKLYKAHSFRKGFATEASHKGYSTETIRSLGRWKSDAYKLYLIVSKTNFRHSVSLLVHLKYMFHLYDELLLIEEHLLRLLSLYIFYRACGFTIPRSKRKVLQNFFFYSY